MANDVAARIHIKFVMSGDDIIKQINAITSAIKDSGVSARAIADIFSAASKRAAEEAKAAATVKAQEIKKEMNAEQSKAREAAAAAQSDVAAAHQRVAASAEVVAAKQQETAAIRAAATNARTAAMGAARGARGKGGGTPEIVDPQALPKVNAFRAALASIGKEGAAALKGIATLFARIAVVAGGIALNAVKNIAKAIISIPLAPLKALNNAFGDIGRIIAGMLGFQGLKSLGRNIGELVKQTGPIEALRVQFANFMQQARYNTEGFTSSTKDLIAEMQRMTGGAIDVTSMLKNSNLAFALIGDQVGKDLPKLMGIAQAAALSTGQTVDYMMESLARGIGRLSTRWIDNTGISMDATAEYKRYGAEIGKAHNTLTQAERIQALLNGTMREGERILLKTGNVTVFLQTQMAQFTGNLKNMRDGAIAAFAPFATVALMYINKFTSEATPKIEDWSEGFVRQFAKIPPVIEGTLVKSMIDMGTYTEEGVKRAAAAMESGSQQMGRHASDWAVNALTWGANTGSQFAIGIMNGFAMFISTAMNFISSVLTNWLSPGSPPKVVPYIDKWGEAAMGEWVKGMMNYPIHDAFPQIKEDLRALLDQDVKDNLFQWGVDAIAEWAKGLSTMDLEFLSKSIDFAFGKAKRLNEELTRSYKSQKSELFKLQVLNRDPQAIKAQIKKVTTTKKSLDANEIQLRQLELQKELIQEQLELFRLLARAMKETADRAAKGGKEKAGGGEDTPLVDMPDGAIQLPLVGTSDLEAKIKGIKERLAEIFTDPLKNMKDSFTENAKIIGDAFTTLKDTIAKVMPVAREKFDEFVKKMTEFGTAVKDTFAPDITALGVAIEEAGPKILEGVQSLIEFKELWLFLGGIIAGILTVIGKGILGFATGLTESLGRAGKTLDGWTAEIRASLSQGFFAVLGTIIKGFFALVGTIVDVIAGSVWAGAKGLIDGVLTLFGTSREEIGNTAKMFVGVIRYKINEGFADLLDEMAGWVARFAPNVAQGFSDSATQLRESGASIMREIQAGIQAESDTQTPAIVSSMQRPLTEAQHKMINTPMTWEAYAASMGNDFVAGIDSTIPQLQSSMDLIMKSVDLQSAGVIESGWVDVGASFPASMSTGILSGQADLEESIHQLFLPIITNESAAIGDGAALIGEQFMSGLSSTVLTQMPDTQEAIRAAGAAIPDSFALGVTQSTPAVEESLESLRARAYQFRGFADEFAASMGEEIRVSTTRIEGEFDHLNGRSLWRAKKAAIELAEAGAQIPIQLGAYVAAEIPRMGSSLDLIASEINAAAALAERECASFTKRGLAPRLFPDREINETRDRISVFGVDLSKDFIRGIGDGMDQGYDAVAAPVNGLIGYVMETARDKADARSPSRKFMDLGKDMVLGLRDGINRNVTYATTAIGGLMQAVINAMGGAAGNLNTTAANIMRNMVDAMLAIARSADSFYAVGAAITAGIQNGMSASLPAFKKYAWDYAWSIREQLERAWGIASPSKVFAQIGEYAVQGLSLGLSTMKNIPIGAMAGSLGDRAAMGLGQIHGAGSAQSVTVEVNAPIVGQMVVPNMVVGREMSKQISRDIGDMAMLRRSPA